MQSTECDESPSASQLFLAQSISVPFFRGMAPPAATPPPGVPNPLDARAVACIERVHELRKDSFATGTSPLPDYDDDTVLSPVQLSHVSTPGAHASASSLASARPLPSDGPADLGGWANADAIAVIPPGSGTAGDVVVLLDPLGRPAGPTPPA